MSASSETLEIPTGVRRTVDERDGYHCRVCGEYLGPDRRALHHIVYGGDARGMGGRRVHDPDQIVTVGWLPGQDCHRIVHERKRLWQPILTRVTSTPGVTGLQLLRWGAQRRR